MVYFLKSRQERMTGQTFIQAINRYVAEINGIYRSGTGTEHSYRPALKTLLEHLTAGLTITNEPKRIACGAPDYIITQGDIPVGYIEAKDIPVGVHNKASKEQFDRYKRSLDNLIITDYLTFELFVDGELAVSVSIAQEKSGTIQADKKQYSAFTELIKTFAGFRGNTIYQSEQLAQMMAGKARLLAAVIEQALSGKNAEDDSLSGQLKAFRKILIHDLGPAAFADIYAQTLAYGLFAARMNDRSADTFNRGKAATLIPQSNPFLRKFFQYIAGYDLDERIRWIVDALADLFNWVAVEELLKEFGRANQDPFIHFYETFLAEYDPKLRESRGVYYTPLPVVRFIVQAVDDLLQTEFGLSKGLADNSKITRAIQGSGGTKKPVEFHRVQILDPAAGTGTFLAEVIGNIYRRFTRQKGLWTGYCAEHLIPRLNGFELLMAPYAMAHFKLDMILEQTGYQANADTRIRVYLTNSLEEPESKVPVLLMEKWLSDEAAEANGIKRDTPVMVVLGNPPYSVSSQNKGTWIEDLLDDYKINLHEKNIQPLSDDYIKFIRYGQYFIDHNGSGILAYISNNSFLDGLIHRQMRKRLLESFDRIYLLNLHGNTRKKERIPDDGKDINVFDIQQGVSINLFVKTGKKNTAENAAVFYYDLFGKREEKYQFLIKNTISTVPWQKIKPAAPQYFFITKDFSRQADYEESFGIQELFPVNTSGIKTHDDKNLVSFEPFKHNNQLYSYRPFDIRFINYDLTKVVRHRYQIMRHFLQGKNIGLIYKRGFTENAPPAFIANTIIDIRNWSCPGMQGSDYIAPLYCYPASDDLDHIAQRQPNLNLSIVTEIAEKTGLRFTAEKEASEDAFAPIDLLDYSYAVLHSPAYRQKYREFLKIDFPRVPYPETSEQFTDLAALGATLRGIHLLETVNYSGNLAEYPIEGNNTIDKPEYRDAKVWINKQQYFDAVPPELWDFYIGGYQPAQKWLKDRKGRSLNYDEIEHYQKILAALQSTITVQAQIDRIIGD
jgi:predicted helicase